MLIVEQINYMEEINQWIINRLKQLCIKNIGSVVYLDCQNNKLTELNYPNEYEC